MDTTNELEQLGLTGQTIGSLRIDTFDESYLYLHTLNDVLVWMTNADCCSETWFSDITGVANLLGHVILAATMFDPPEVDDGRCRQESDYFYGVRITTDAGDCEIVYRNSSNGYYGGSIALSTASPRAFDKTLPITTDWHAPKRNWDGEVVE